MALQNDDLDIESAQLTGRSTANARAAKYRDLLIQSADRLEAQFHDEMPGPDPRVSLAQERMEAITASGRVYRGVMDRDERLGYAAAGLWVAFGFAAALSRDKRLRTYNVREADGHAGEAPAE